MIVLILFLIINYQAFWGEIWTVFLLEDPFKHTKWSGFQFSQKKNSPMSTIELKTSLFQGSVVQCNVVYCCAGLHEKLPVSTLSQMPCDSLSSRIPVKKTSSYILVCLSLLHLTSLYWSAALYMYCGVLHFTALHCTALHCTELHLTDLHCNVLHCTLLYYTSPHCTTLHRTTLHCTALHCTNFSRVLTSTCNP